MYSCLQFSEEKKERGELANKDDKKKNACEPSILRVRIETDEKKGREELHNF